LCLRRTDLLNIDLVLRALPAIPSKGDRFAVLGKSGLYFGALETNERGGFGAGLGRSRLAGRGGNDQSQDTGDDV
jgi:hypothetical protein